MKNKSKRVTTKSPILTLLKVIGAITVVGLMIISIFLIREPYENDNVPHLTSNNFMITKINSMDHKSDAFKEAKPCSNSSEVISKTNYVPLSEYAEDYLKCFETTLDGKQVYLIEPGLACFYTLYIETDKNVFEKVIELTGKYPCNQIKNLLGGTQSIIFSYEGWHNPLKYIELKTKE